MSLLAYFDCFAGIAGDMALGALFDLGVPEEAVLRPLEGLGLEGLEVKLERVTRGGISALRVSVKAGRELAMTPPALLSLLEEAPLPPRARRLASGCLRRVLEAEARIHGRDPSHLHLHELGSPDTLVDIAGVALALDYLGVEEVMASPLPTGTGMIRGEHGLLPIPSPAVLEILKGAPLYSRPIQAELVTPTGAAILAGVGASFGPLPPMKLLGVGYGAGGRELEIPNILRVLLGERIAVTQPEVSTLLLLEASVDDMNPQLYQHVVEGLLERGALDAWVTPVVMKKGRPGAVLSVLCELGAEASLAPYIFRETTTLGLRRVPVERWALPREIFEVEVGGEKVRVKVGRMAGKAVTVTPEYSDAARVAASLGLPLKEVLARALAEALSAVAGTAGPEDRKPLA